MTTILALLALPVIVLFMWFAMEYARVTRYAGRAKVAADAAALAAAARYADGNDVARVDAVNAAAEHQGPQGPLVLEIGEGPGGGGDLEFGDWDPQSRTFTPNTSDGGRAVRATVRFSESHPNGTVPLLLAGFFGISPASLERSGIAVYSPPTHTTSLLLADSGGSALSATGKARVRARGGVSVASAAAAAVNVSSGALLDISVLRAAGSVDSSVEERVTGSVKQGASIPDDPFAATAMPLVEQGAGEAIPQDGAPVIHVEPGEHAAFTASSGTFILDRGLHQFDGAIALSGTAVLELADATVQLQDGAALEVTGGAELRGTCASGIPNWDGYAIIQRPGSAQWTVSGGGAIRVAGRLYGADAHVAVTGSGELRAQAAVAHSLTVGDGGAVRLTSDVDEIALPVVPGRARAVR